MAAYFKIFYRSFRKHRFAIAGLAVIGFISGLFGGLGINALIPLFTIVVGGPVATDPVSRFVSSTISLFGFKLTTTSLLSFVVVLFFLKAIMLVLFAYINSRITADYEDRTRQELFDATMAARWPYLVRQRLGFLEKVLMSDVGYGKSMMVQVSSGMLALANLVVYSFIAVNVSWHMTALTFAMAIIFFSLIFRPIIRRVKLIADRDEHLGKEIAHFINEHIVGIKTIKVTATAQRVADIGRKYFGQIRDLRVRSGIVGSLSSALLEPTSLVFLSVVFVLSVGTPGFHLASFIVVLYASKQIFTYLEQLHSLATSSAGILPFIRRVEVYRGELSRAAEPELVGKPFSFKEELSLEHVSFQYNPEQVAVLQDVSLSVRRGEMIGLIGPSGAGKTTLVDLILRLLEPTGGVLKLDGVPVQEVSLSNWRNQVGYVSQDIFLINDTVRNNISFYGNNISEAEIVQAAKDAQIHDFIMTLPKKYDTNVGERGAFLSGGQRQRIIIARALVRRPQLLILDEATSALDGESEQKIQEIVKNLKGAMTVIAIAHRLSTVAVADRLLVLEAGRIIESGTPADLLANKESYFTKMYNLRS